MKLLVCVSGGVDSMSLLHFLHKLKVDLVVLNINHNTRDTNLEEKELVENYSNQLDPNYKFISVDLDLKDVKLGFEEKARLKRYEVFNKIKENENCDRICLGHHIDDNVETVIFNWFRATTLNLEIPEYDEETKIWRPFLKLLTKEEIYDYAVYNDVPYIEDCTNNDEEVSDRNFIRALVSKFKNRRNLNKVILSNTKYYSDLKDYLNKSKEKEIFDLEYLVDQSSKQDNYIRVVQKFNSLHIVMKHEIIKDLCYLVFGSYAVQIKFSSLNNRLDLFRKLENAGQKTKVTKKMLDNTFNVSYRWFD